MNKPEPTTIGGRYEVGELLGRGGMAEVRKGQDTRLGRVVAIKRLRTDLASDTTFQARFRREAQSSASLNHPAIVAVYDTGEETTEADGETVAQPYIVMEFVAGRTLRDILREGRKILPERALEITSDVLSALDYSHRAGIIHRDIKPGNVMLTPSGDVKVMDFGIARAISDASSTMTQTAAVVGTAQYLSPEQARGESVDSRSDVYSAGCLLYELLTGRPPFVGDSPVSVAYQHVREQATPPSDHDTALPPEVDAIVMKSLAKRVEDRYQSAAAMRADIERYLAGRPVEAVIPPHVPLADTATTAVVAPTAVAPAAAAAETEEEDEPRGPRPWLVLLLGLIVLALVAVGAFFLPALFEEAPERAAIPNVLHKTETQAVRLITAEGLTPKVTYASDEKEPAKRVIDQSPPGGQGAYTDPGDTITITVSTGPPDVEMPSVANQQLAQARATLESDPYNFTVSVKRVASDEDEGTVLKSTPPAGQTLTSGNETRVVLEVSRGPKAVPQLVGKKQARAEQMIRDAGFVPVVREDPGSKKPAGTVTFQNPDPGTRQPQNSNVLILVSTYQEPLPECPTETINPSDGSTSPIEPDPGDPATCTPPPDQPGDEESTPTDPSSSVAPSDDSDILPVP